MSEEATVSSQAVSVAPYINSLSAEAKYNQAKVGELRQKSKIIFTRIFMSSFYIALKRRNKIYSEMLSFWVTTVNSHVQLMREISTTLKQQQQQQTGKHKTN